MSASNQETVTETGRTPSMVASLLVVGVMIALILLSVVLFGSEVAEGPLQVSMTLATLFALSVALYYGFRGAVISDAISPRGLHSEQFNGVHVPSESWEDLR